MSKLISHTLLLSSLLCSTPLLAAEPANPAEPIKADEQPADSIAASSYDLDELVVVTQRPAVTSDGAKLTFDMQADPSVKALTLNDALRKVPMVSVDGEGNIRINGQDNFKIYVNGKEDPSLSANYKNIFKAMPASSVVKVEVITEPGAKYDAEGTAGILNLVTVTRNSTDGYSGTISGSFSKVQAGASLYGRMKSGRLAMSANIDYYNATLFPQHNDNENLTEYLDPTNPYSTSNRIEQNVVWKYLGAGLNLSYDLSDHDLLTANFNINNVDASLRKGGQSISKIFNAEGELTGSMHRDLTGSIRNLSLTAGAAWQHDFSHDGEKLILSYLFSHGIDKLDALLDERESAGSPIASPYEDFHNHGKTSEHTVQLDYISPLFAEAHTIEAGGKGIFRHNPAVSSTLRGLSADDILLEGSDFTDIVQKQNIYALYVSYNGKFGNFAATAGVRYEHTDMGIDFNYDTNPLTPGDKGRAVTPADEGRAADFMNHLNDVVPNAALTYMFGPASNLRLAYQMRISRPSLSQVNPFCFTYVPGIVDTGNPDLSSERSNKISLTYSNFGRVAGGNIGVEYSTIDNAISRYTYKEDDVIINTYANLGHNRIFALFGFMNWNIINNMQFSVNARLQYRSLSSGEPKMSNSGWTLNAGANWNWSLPRHWKAYAYGGGNTRDYSLQGWNDGWYYYGLGISKSFLAEEALTVSLSANQFLQSQITHRSMIETENMRNSFTFYNKNWNVGVSVSWNFGSLKNDVRKTSRGISNDDQSKAKGNSMM